MRTWRAAVKLGAVLVAVLGGSGAFAACPDVPGDLNDSGNVTVVDVQCGILVLLWELTGQLGPAPACLSGDAALLDVNCGGNSDLPDVQILIQYALGIPLAPQIDGNADGCVDNCEVAAEVAPLQFFGDARFINGPLELQTNDPLYAGLGLEVRVQSWPPDPQHQATLHWRVGSGDFTAVPMVVAAQGVGPFGTNTEWEAALPAAALGGGTVELYLSATDGESTLYVSNGGANYFFPVNLPGGADPLEFIGNSTFSTGDLGRAAGQPLFEGVGLDVAVQTWPPSLDHTVTLFYTTDDYATIQSAAMTFSADKAGEFGANFLWTATIPEAALEGASELVLWMNATNGTTTLWDSNFSANYKFPVSSPSEVYEVGFAQAGKFTFSKCWWNGTTCSTGWQYSPGVADPMLASYSQYQVYGAWTHLAAEVYVAGITDRDPTDPFVAFALQNFFRVRVKSPIFAGSPTAEPVAKPLGVSGKAGNNFIFQWQFFSTGCVCPIDFSWPTLGVYPYVYEYSMDGGQTWQPLPIDATAQPAQPLEIDWQLAPL
jgi:hypothetical protein